MLDQNDKLERFAEVINKSVEKQCKKINKNSKEFREKELGDLEKQCADEFASRLEFEKIRISNETNKKVSEIESLSKKKLADRRNEIMTEVFSKARKKLEEFTESAQYDDFLKRSISNLCGEIDGDVKIFVRKADENKASQLSSSLNRNITVVVAEDILIGGAYACNKDESIFLYDTLDTRLESRKEIFMRKSGLAAV